MGFTSISAGSAGEKHRHCQGCTTKSPAKRRTLHTWTQIRASPTTLIPHDNIIPRQSVRPPPHEFHHQYGAIPPNPRPTRDQTKETRSRFPPSGEITYPPHTCRSLRPPRGAHGKRRAPSRDAIGIRPSPFLVFLVEASYLAGSEARGLVRRGSDVATRSAVEGGHVPRGRWITLGRVDEAGDKATTASYHLRERERERRRGEKATMASTPLEYGPRFSSINTGRILRSFSSLSSSFTFSSLLAASNAFAIRSTHSGTF